MKIKDIIKVDESLKKLAGLLLSNSSDNYKVYKIYSEVRDDLNNYYTQRDKIVTKYGSKNENGTISILSDNLNFQKAINAISELEEIEVELSIEAIKLNADDIKLSAIDLYNLTEFGLLEIIEARVGE